MKIIVLPMPDIVQIMKEIVVQSVDDDDDVSGDDEDNDALKPGRYGMDGAGRIWKMQGGATDLISAFDANAPEIKAERIKKRAAKKKSKRRAKR